MRASKEYPRKISLHLPDAASEAYGITSREKQLTGDKSYITFLKKLKKLTFSYLIYDSKIGVDASNLIFWGQKIHDPSNTFLFCSSSNFLVTVSDP